MKKFIPALALCLLPVAVARAQEPQQHSEQQQQPVTQNEPAKTTPWRAPQSARPKPLEVIPEEVFDSELKGLDGGSFYLSNYRGQVFVINVWATWCGPCRADIPELNRIYNDYKGRGVEFIGLTTEDPETDSEGVKKFAAAFQMKYKLGFIDSEAARRLLNGRPSIPQTFVVAADGRVVTHFIGYSNNIPPHVRKGIEEAMNPTAAVGRRP